MSAVREWRSWWGATEGWTRLEGMEKADAAISEQAARIAELEAENKAKQHSIDAAALQIVYTTYRREQAEAALARRDRMYRDERLLRQKAESALTEAIRHPNGKLSRISEYVYRIEHARAEEGTP